MGQQQQRSTYQGKYPGNYYNSSNPKQPSLRELTLEQARINESISKKLAFNDKVLENINTKMDNVSSTIQDQLSYNKKIESQLAQLASAMPLATNLEKVNAITTRGGKSTHDPPYPPRPGKTPAVQQEKKNDEVKKLKHKNKNCNKIFMTPTSYRFHEEIKKPKWMSSLVSL